MIENECPRHDEVHTAARAGVWPPELTAHAAACARCQETIFVSRGLFGLARVDAERAGPLPDARSTFLRSRLVARIEEEEDLVERAARPLLVANLLAIGAVLAALAWLGGYASTAMPELVPWKPLSWSLASVGLGALASRRLIWMDE